MLGTRVGGGYVLKALLGEGGMGQVYLAEHELLGATKRKAVKLLLGRWTQSSDIVERFKREARAAASVESRHVLGVDDFGQLPDGQLYMIMPLLEGQALDSFLETRGQVDGGFSPEHARLSAVDALYLVAQMGRGLKAIHKANLVHRDLKPSNTFLSREFDLNPFVRLLDLGIAKVLNDEGEAVHTRTGQVIGTPAYMSPEQAVGSRSVDHRSDIFSLGVILYEMVSGRMPFQATSIGALALQHMHERPALGDLVRDDVPWSFASVIGQALNYRPDDRPQSAEDLVSKLAQSVSGGLEVVRAAGAKELIEERSHASTTVASDAADASGHGPPPPMMFPLASGAPPASAARAQGASRNPSTLAAATGSPSIPAPVGVAGRRRSRWVLATGAIVAIGGATVASITLADRSAEQDGAASAASVDAAPSAAPMVDVRVASEPIGATVFLDGVAQGTAPLTVNLPKGVTATVRAELAGYRAAEEVITSADVGRTVRLMLPVLSVDASVALPVDASAADAAPERAQSSGSKPPRSGHRKRGEPRSGTVNPDDILRD